MLVSLKKYIFDLENVLEVMMLVISVILLYVPDQSLNYDQEVINEHNTKAKFTKLDKCLYNKFIFMRRVYRRHFESFFIDAVQMTLSKWMYR